MFNFLKDDKIKSYDDYIKFVRKYILLVENEFNFLETKFKNGEKVGFKIPLLISIVNRIDALRGQDGIFINFRNELKGKNDYQSELYEYEGIFNQRLETFILNVLEKENLLEDKSFQ